MPTLERSGAKIYYEKTGDGPPVILGHSLLCDGRMWEHIAPSLAERYTVYNVDFRGHRHSSAPYSYRLDDLAEDWTAIMDAEGIDRAALIGLSMGGMTAMLLALAHPDRVAGMALLDSNADAEDLIKKTRYRIMNMIYRRFGFNRILGASVGKIMFGKRTLRERPELVAQLTERVREHDPEHITRAIKAVFSRRDIRHRIGVIHCPVLVLVGEYDVATPIEKSERIHTAIPGSVLQVVPDAGHLSALEEPEWILPRLLDFLATCDWGEQADSATA